MSWLDAIGKILPIVATSVNVVEAVSSPDIHGAQKQQAAMTAINGLVQAIEIGLPSDILADANFQAMIKQLIDTYVSIQNFVAARKAASSTPPTTTTTGTT